MADAQASGACGSNTVWVQVPSSALLYKEMAQILSGSFLYRAVQTSPLKPAASRSRLPARSARKHVVRRTTLAPSSALVKHPSGPGNQPFPGPSLFRAMVRFGTPRHFGGRRRFSPTSRGPLRPRCQRASCRSGRSWPGCRARPFFCLVRGEPRGASLTADASPPGRPTT